MGIPNEYTTAYLTTAVENAAADAIERLQEKIVRNNVLQIYILISIVIGIIGAIKFSDSFFEGVLEFSSYMLPAIAYYMILTWIARFIARGFKSNLIGLRGLLVNGITAIVLIVFLIFAVFFVPEEDKESWSKFTSNDNKFSVLMPFEPNEIDAGIFRLSNGERTARKRMYLEASKKSFNAEFNIDWATHSELPNEFEDRVEDYEKSIIEKGGAKILSKEKLPNNVHSFVFDLPGNYSVATKMLIVGETLYFITITTEDANIQDPDVSKFFDSFKAN